MVDVSIMVVQMDHVIMLDVLVHQRKLRLRLRLQLQQVLYLLACYSLSNL